MYHIAENKSLKLKFIWSIMVFFSLTSLWAQQKNFVDMPYLETTAKVDTLVQPDEIYLKIILKEQDERNKVSIEKMESRMIDALQKIGINTQTQLKLYDFSSNFKRYFLKSKDVMKKKSYELKVSNAQIAGRALQALEYKGISNTTLSHTKYSKIEQLKLTLRRKAIQKAKKQAQSLVEPIGQRIGSALHILDNSSAYHHYDNHRPMMAKAMRGAPAMEVMEEVADIDFKPIKIETQISVKFSIQ